MGKYERAALQLEYQLLMNCVNAGADLSLLDARRLDELEKLLRVGQLAPALDQSLK